MHRIKQMVNEIQKKNLLDIRDILHEMKINNSVTEPFYTGGVTPIRVKKIRTERTTE